MTNFAPAISRLWRRRILFLLLALLPQSFLDLLLAPAVAKIATS